jgi:hypothetical protein
VIAADAGRHLGDNPIVSAIFGAYALNEAPEPGEQTSVGALYTLSIEEAAR